MDRKTSESNYLLTQQGIFRSVLYLYFFVRFDSINDEFQTLMKDVSKEPNVVVATNQAGLPEQLEGIQAQLSLCEKALAEYLETKRLAFPRFYFASSADLLDILSNSDYPQKVAKHLTKLFDSMAKLTMKEEGSKLAIAMTAKDGEVVEFSLPCECKDQVEVWLNRCDSILKFYLKFRLMGTMRETIRAEFAKAMGTYIDTPRETWLFDYPAQVGHY